MSIMRPEGMLQFAWRRGGGGRPTTGRGWSPAHHATVSEATLVLFADVGTFKPAVSIVLRASAARIAAAPDSPLVFSVAVPNQPVLWLRAPSAAERSMWLTRLPPYLSAVPSPSRLRKQQSLKRLGLLPPSPTPSAGDSSTAEYEYSYTDMLVSVDSAIAPPPLAPYSHPPPPSRPSRTHPSPRSPLAAPPSPSVSPAPSPSPASPPPSPQLEPAPPPKPPSSPLHSSTTDARSSPDPSPDHSPSPPPSHSTPRPRSPLSPLSPLFPASPALMTRASSLSSLSSRRSPPPPPPAHPPPPGATHPPPYKAMVAELQAELDAEQHARNALAAAFDAELAAERDVSDGLRAALAAEQRQVDDLRRRLRQAQADAVAAMEAAPLAHAPAADDNAALLARAKTTIEALTAELRAALDERDAHVCGEKWESETVAELVAETLQLERSVVRLAAANQELEAKLEHTCNLLLDANQDAATARDDANATTALLTATVQDLDAELAALSAELAAANARNAKLEDAVALLSDRYDAVVNERNTLLHAAHRTRSVLNHSAAPPP